ncbi:hypothetical protein JCM19235_4157 [Vibrio maritimus]|uniref:Uncharacterized protein n=1 Tax=Vibrio maritimus TaxID=990268 RepID=A0A090SKM3_9VIBR|nr:hypothetical protein JCM19235_4157 [Vibrio maritimus]
MEYSRPITLEWIAVIVSSQLVFITVSCLPDIQLLKSGCT